MLRRLIVTGLAALGLVAASAAPARADWMLTPFLGVTFGGDTTNQRPTYGAAITWMAGGVVGFEIDGAISPDLLDTDDGLDLGVSESNVSTLMANVVVGAPLGAPGVRPYASGGIGLIRASAGTVGEFFDVDDNSFGVNAGVGLVGFVREHFGLRGDLRYFRSLQDSGNGSDLRIRLGDFDFWRATLGATFRF